MNWAVLLAGLAGGFLLSKFMQPPQQQGAAPAPSAPLAPPPGPAAPDTAQTPDYNALLRANTKGSRSGPSAGPASTFRTGASGIDPSQLALGTNTLLGT